MTIGAGWAEGAWVDASWVVGAWEPVTAVKTIGGTSQLEVFTSSGTLVVQTNHTIGSASQLEAFSATGGIVVQTNHTIGGSSSLEAFTSSGGIQVGDVVALVTKGGETRITKQQVAKERRLREEHLKRVARDRKELDRLFPAEAIEELATTGEVEINGIQVKAPKVPRPVKPEVLLSDLTEIKKNLLTITERTKMADEEREFDEAIEQHKKDLLLFEEEFAAFLMLAML